MGVGGGNDSIGFRKDRVCLSSTGTYSHVHRPGLVIIYKCMLLEF